MSGSSRGGNGRPRKPAGSLVPARPEFRPFGKRAPAGVPMLLPADGLSDRLPPQQIEAEMALLGAALLRDRAAVERLIAAVYGDGDSGAGMDAALDFFYREAHAHIFDSMVAVYGRLQDGEELDIVALKDELNRRSKLEEVGGWAYLMQLAEFVPTTANLAYYRDIVAEKAALRGVIEAAGEVAGMAYGEVEDPEALIESAAERIRSIAAPLRRRRGGTGAPCVPLKVALLEEIEEAEERGNRAETNPGGVTGLSVGLADFDYLTSGLQPTDLWIVAGASSMGKTGAMVTMARNSGRASLATGGGAVHIASCEMHKKQLARRLLAQESGVEAHRIRAGTLTTGEWEKLLAAYASLSELPITIDDRTGQTCDQIRQSLRHAREQFGGLAACYIDYIQIMRPGGRRQWENRNAEVTEIAQGVKNLGREFEIAVVGGCQINRNNTRRDDKRPTLGDLRESDAIAQEADGVIGLYRPSYYEKKDPAGMAGMPDVGGPGPDGRYPTEEAEMIILKQRNGPTGTIKLLYTPALTLFSDLPDFDPTYQDGDAPPHYGDSRGGMEF